MVLQVTSGKYYLICAPPKQSSFYINEKDKHIYNQLLKYFGRVCTWEAIQCTSPKEQLKEPLNQAIGMTCPKFKPFEQNNVS